jgi:CRISPR-associated protein Csx14
MEGVNYREIFVFVLGTTPQIITETIYALSQNKPPVYPDSIYIITTKTGRDRVHETLIKKDILTNLTKEYKLPEIPINDDSFVLIRDHEGNELDDIRDKKANEATGNLITEFIKNLTTDMNSRLHCSIAGGRKTMSFYLGAALELFGRPWDRLYHILVSPEFESNPYFFYKPKKERLIETRLTDGTIKKISTNDAVIDLAELPFIRLSSKLILRKKDFQSLIEESQREIDTATLQLDLRVNLSDRTIYIGDTLIEMVPVQLMIYTALLRQKIVHCIRPERKYCLDCTDCFRMVGELAEKKVREEMAQDYKKIYHGNALRTEELLQKWNKALSPGDIVRQNISKINRSLKEQLQDTALLPYYTITNIKKYGGTRYGLKVEKKKIWIE